MGSSKASMEAIWRSTVDNDSKKKIQSGVRHYHNGHYHRPIFIATGEPMLPSEDIPLIDIRACSIADYKGILCCRKRDAISVGHSLPPNGGIHHLKHLDQIISV